MRRERERERATVVPLVLDGEVEEGEQGGLVALGAAGPEHRDERFDGVRQLPPVPRGRLRQPPDLPRRLHPALLVCRAEVLHDPLVLRPGSHSGRAPPGALGGLVPAHLACYRRHPAPPPPARERERAREREEGGERKR